MDKKINIGDFSCLHNKVSEFLYEANDYTVGYAIKRNNFLKIMNTPIGKLISPNV
jgi:hypothetical protein